MIVVSDIVGTEPDLVDAAVDEAFWDLVCADEDWLRSEFEEIVSAGCPERPSPDLPLLPPRPAGDGPRPRVEGPVALRVRDAGSPLPVARQRGPPPRAVRPHSTKEVMTPALLTR